MNVIAVHQGPGRQEGRHRLLPRRVRAGRRRGRQAGRRGRSASRSSTTARARSCPPSATNPNPDNSAVVQRIVSLGRRPGSTPPSTRRRWRELMGGAPPGATRASGRAARRATADQLLKRTPRRSSTPPTASRPTRWPRDQRARHAGDGRRHQGARPDARASDAYVYGWTEAQITEAILKQAAESGDMTRAGVVKAAFEHRQGRLRRAGPVPDAGRASPNDYVVRESYMFKPKLSLYKEGPTRRAATRAPS